MLINKLQALKNKILFCLRFKTLKSIMAINDYEVVVYCSKGIFKMDRRCPHQGAYLEGFFKKDNILTCHWHGCRLTVDLKGERI